ncbi:low affinity iron permease family protein [Mesorhizobium australicum]|uniref:low affinity iron permease family protein n=1 Tax=Mesorhizobium TaxID=68287 RepID=UPI0003F885BA|nr:low affinity iron permease family protein [Mesorhizobium sp. LNHC229A00]
MIEKLFTKFSNQIAHLTGLPLTFAVCCLIVIVWAVSGPFFNFSDTWQLVINTGTTIITFLMVFLIQNTQNRDGAAIQAKLDELIRVSEAKNTFIGIEHLTEGEVQEIRAKCEVAARRHDDKVATMAAKKVVAAKRKPKKEVARSAGG